MVRNKFSGLVDEPARVERLGVVEEFRIVVNLVQEGHHGRTSWNDVRPDLDVPGGASRNSGKDEAADPEALLQDRVDVVQVVLRPIVEKFLRL